MSRPFVFALLAVAGLAPAAAAQQAPAVTNRTWVVAVGIQDYAHLGKLSFCRDDAAAVAAAFRANGTPDEQILLLTDAPDARLRPDRAAVERLVPEFLLRARGGDTVVFFFSGHGLAEDGLYLMPLDGRKGRARDTGLSLELVRAWMDRCAGATKKVLLLDACHSGDAETGERAVRPTGKQLVDAFGHADGFFTIASCLGAQRSLPYREGGLGLFTFWLVKGLLGEADTDRDRAVTADELYAYLHKHMTDPTQPLGGLQTPVRRFVGENAVVTAYGGKWVRLFNGKDLTGWKTQPDAPGGWRVERGVLVGGGPRQSHLFSAREDFEDFHLRVEARINDGGNSGVYVRAPFARNGLPPGFEAQINSTTPDVKTGGLYYFDGGMKSVPFREALAGPGEWFILEVVAKAERLTVKVNGRTTTDFADPKRLYRRGHIALQQHDARSAPEFRLIEIKE